MECTKIRIDEISLDSRIRIRAADPATSTGLSVISGGIIRNLTVYDCGGIGAGQIYASSILGEIIDNGALGDQ